MIIKPKNTISYPKESVEIIIDTKVEDTTIEDIEETQSLTISSIVSTLMSAKVSFHVLHFQTNKHSVHLALDEFYTNITKLSDNIIECLLGRFNTRIEQSIVITANPLVHFETELNIKDHINLFNNFVEELSIWSSINNYQDINNLSAELTQLINQTKYKLSLC